MLKTYVMFGVLFFAYSLNFCQTKNRVALSYQFGYIIERAEFSKIGLHLNLERKLHPNWSIAFEWAFEDYCRCDLKPYRFKRSRQALTNALSVYMQSNPNPDEAAISRFSYWNLLGNYHWQISQSSRSIIIGTGLTYRPGIENFYLYKTSFELIFDGRFSYNWAIPIRLAYRYDPPRRWWGLTAYLMYQGYFSHNSHHPLGKTPIHVLQAGLNFDIRFGKREELKRE